MIMILNIHTVKIPQGYHEHNEPNKRTRRYLRTIYLAAQYSIGMNTELHGKMHQGGLSVVLFGRKYVSFHEEHKQVRQFKHFKYFSGRIICLIFLK